MMPPRPSRPSSSPRRPRCCWRCCGMMICRSLNMMFNTSAAALTSPYLKRKMRMTSPTDMSSWSMSKTSVISSTSWRGPLIRKVPSGRRMIRVGSFSSGEATVRPISGAVSGASGGSGWGVSTRGGLAGVGSSTAAAGVYRTGWNTAADARRGGQGSGPVDFAGSGRGSPNSSCSMSSSNTADSDSPVSNGTTRRPPRWFFSRRCLRISGSSSAPQRSSTRVGLVGLPASSSTRTCSTSPRAMRYWIITSEAPLGSYGLITISVFTRRSNCRINCSIRANSEERHLTIRYSSNQSDSMLGLQCPSGGSKSRMSQARSLALPRLRSTK